MNPTAAEARSRGNRPDKAEVLRAILAREATGQAMNAVAVLREDGRLHWQALRTFGRWEAALQAAGIDPARVRRIRRWTRQAVIDRIQQLADRGIRLNRTTINTIDASLPLSARRFFPSWDDALRAAGVDPHQHRRKGVTWTRDRIVAAIREIRAKGGDLHVSGVAIHSLAVAAIRLFGSWDAALKAAGIDPTTVRRQRPAWTRQEFVEILRRKHAAGERLNAKNVSPGSLYNSACHLFGTWDAALEAAGIDPKTVRLCRKWTSDQIVQEIRRKHQTGEPLNAGAVQPRTLHTIGTQRFGSWDGALVAAGLDPLQIRIQQHPPTAADIITELQRKHSMGEKLNSRYVQPRALHQSARRVFGSWDAALNAAGIDPQQVRLRRMPWTVQDLLRELRRRGRIADANSNGKVGLPVKVCQAASRLFGSTTAAIVAAGLDPGRFHWCQPPWTEVSVLEAILTRKEAGRPLHTAAVIAEAPRLYVAGRRWFGGWYPALAAAGIDPASVRREHAPYTQDHIIRTLRCRAKAEQDIAKPGLHSESFRKAAKRLFGSWQDALAAAGLEYTKIRRRRRDAQ